MAEIIDGKALASTLDARTAQAVRAFITENGVAPGLAVVLVGEDPASQVYVRRKIARCRTVGIRSIEHRLPLDTSESDLSDLIDQLNGDHDVHGILIQLPLPGTLNAGVILDRIDPAKDVDGFHPVNVGRLSTGTGGLVPCTPLGCMMMLDGIISDYRGLNAVVIGKSNIVGKPIALMLLEREATVTVTHIETLDLAGIVGRADIVVAAAGSPGLVRGHWVKSGAIVIDVGITRVTEADGSTRIVGDCATNELQHVLAITPVPGGVGPMTIACLLANTVRAAEMISKDG